MANKVRYPVDNWQDWYDAQPYGSKTTYGYHEGADINLKTGGNSDYGQNLYPVYKGEVTFIEHKDTGFGSHIVYKIQGPWGTRWIHYAHCIPESIQVKVGSVVYPDQVMAKVGHSGNSRYNGVPVAHTHWACAKFATTNEIAKTETDLQKWEDPIKFVAKYLGWEGGEEDNMDDDKKRGIAFLDQYRGERKDADGNPRPEGNYESYVRSVVQSDKDFFSVKKNLDNANLEKAQLSGKLENATKANETLQGDLDDIYETLNKELGVSDIDTPEEVATILHEKIKQLQEQQPVEPNAILEGLKKFIEWVKSIWK